MEEGGGFDPFPFHKLSRLPDHPSVRTAQAAVCVLRVLGVSEQILSEIEVRPQRPVDAGIPSSFDRSSAQLFENALHWDGGLLRLHSGHARFQLKNDFQQMWQVRSVRSTVDLILLNQVHICPCSIPIVLRCAQQPSQCECWA